MTPKTTRRRQVLAAAVLLCSITLSSAPAHAASGGSPFAVAQDCVQAGGQLPEAGLPAPVGSPACTDSTVGHAGSLYFWSAAGAGAGQYGGGVGGYDVVGQDVTATTTGTLTVSAHVSSITPPDLAVPLVGGGQVSATETFTCVVATNLSSGGVSGGCSSARRSFSGPPHVAVSAGDSVRVTASIFIFSVDSAGVCVPPFGQCLAGAAGPRAVTAQLQGFTLQYS